MSCGICLEEKNDLKRIVLTLSCEHIFCRKCLSIYARDELKIKKNVKCPQPDCEHIIVLDGVVGQSHIKNAQKTKRHDQCPVEHCKGMIIAGQCDICHMRVCHQCGELEHPTKTCDPEIKANHQLVLRNTKLCPHCKVPILKNGGCDHMHCSRCNGHFKWTDLKTIDNTYPPVYPPVYQPDNNPVEYPHYDRETLLAMHYNLEEFEPIECARCERLCTYQTGVCCWCGDKREKKTTLTYADGVGYVEVFDLRLHYCPLCK